MSILEPIALVAFRFWQNFFMIFGPFIYAYLVLHALQHYMAMCRSSDVLHIIYIVCFSMFAITPRCDVLKF